MDELTEQLGATPLIAADNNDDGNNNNNNCIVLASTNNNDNSNNNNCNEQGEQMDTDSDDGSYSSEVSSRGENMDLLDYIIIQYISNFPPPDEVTGVTFIINERLMTSYGHTGGHPFSKELGKPSFLASEFDNTFEFDLGLTADDFNTLEYCGPGYGYGRRETQILFKDRDLKSDGWSLKRRELGILMRSNTLFYLRKWNNIRGILDGEDEDSEGEESEGDDMDLGGGDAVAVDTGGQDESEDAVGGDMIEGMVKDSSNDGEGAANAKDRDSTTATATKAKSSSPLAGNLTADVSSAAEETTPGALSDDTDIGGGAGALAAAEDATSAGDTTGASQSEESTPTSLVDTPMGDVDTTAKDHDTTTSSRLDECCYEGCNLHNTSIDLVQCYGRNGEEEGLCNNMFHKWCMINMERANEVTRPRDGKVLQCPICHARVPCPVSIDDGLEEEADEDATPSSGVTGSAGGDASRVGRADGGLDYVSDAVYTERAGSADVSNAVPAAASNDNAVGTAASNAGSAGRAGDGLEEEDDVDFGVSGGEDVQTSNEESSAGHAVSSTVGPHAGRDRIYLGPVRDATGKYKRSQIDVLPLCQCTVGKVKQLAQMVGIRERDAAFILKRSSNDINRALINLLWRDLITPNEVLDMKLNDKITTNDYQLIRYEKMMKVKGRKFLSPHAVHDVNKEKRQLTPQKKKNTQRRRLDNENAEAASDISSFTDLTSGTRVEILWPEEKKYFAATVYHRPTNEQPHRYAVDYDDGTSWYHDLNDAHFRVLEVPSEGDANSDEEENEEMIESQPRQVPQRLQVSVSTPRRSMTPAVPPPPPAKGADPSDSDDDEEEDTMMVDKGVLKSQSQQSSQAAGTSDSDEEEDEVMIDKSQSQQSSPASSSFQQSSQESSKKSSQDSSQKSIHLSRTPESYDFSDDGVSVTSGNIMPLLTSKFDQESVQKLLNKQKDEIHLGEGLHDVEKYFPDLTTINLTDTMKKHLNMVGVEANASDVNPKCTFETPDGDPIRHEGRVLIIGCDVSQNPHMLMIELDGSQTVGSYPVWIEYPAYLLSKKFDVKPTSYHPNPNRQPSPRQSQQSSMSSPRRHKGSLPVLPPPPNKDTSASSPEEVAPPRRHRQGSSLSVMPPSPDEDTSALPAPPPAEEGAAPPSLARTPIRKDDAALRDIIGNMLNTAQAKEVRERHPEARVTGEAVDAKVVVSNEKKKNKAAVELNLSDTLGSGGWKLMSGLSDLANEPTCNDAWKKERVAVIEKLNDMDLPEVPEKVLDRFKTATNISYPICGLSASLLYKIVLKVFDDDLDTGIDLVVRLLADGNNPMCIFENHLLGWKQYAEATGLKSPLDIPSAKECIKKRVKLETNHFKITKAIKVPKPSNQKTPPSDNVDEINKWVNDKLLGEKVRTEAGELVRDVLGVLDGEVWLSVPLEVFGLNKEKKKKVELKKKNFINGNIRKASIYLVSTYGRTLILTSTKKSYKLNTHKPMTDQFPYIWKKFARKKMPIHDLVYKAAAASTTTFSYVPPMFSSVQFSVKGETIDHTAHDEADNRFPALFPAPQKYQVMNQKITTKKLPEGVYWDSRSQFYRVTMTIMGRLLSTYYYTKNHGEGEAKRLATAERRLMEFWRYFEVASELERSNN